MKKLTFLAAAAAALFFTGCAAPQPGANAGNYKGTLLSAKLGQDTQAELSVEGSQAVMVLPKLTENKQPCRATFVPVASRVAGSSVYKSEWPGAIGACRIFVQDPGSERFLLLRGVGNHVEAVIAHDALGQKVMAKGLLK